MKPVPAPRATLADVARRAGVSKATASRAINQLKHVTAATRARVLRAAQELAFQPDPVSRRLAARRSPSALVARGRLAYLRDRPIEPVFLTQAQEVARRLGYDLEPAVITAATVERELRALWARGVEGGLLQADGGQYPPIPESWRDRLALVGLAEAPGFSGRIVAHDYAAGVQVLARELARLGCQRVGCWLVDDRITASHHRAVGAALALQRNQCAETPVIALHTTAPSELTTRHELAAVADWLRRESCDGLIAPSTASVVQLEERLGGRLPVRLAGALFTTPGLRPATPVGTVGFTMAAAQELALIELDRLLVHTGGGQSASLILVPPRWQPPEHRTTHH